MAPKKEFQDKVKKLGGKAKDTMKSIGKKFGELGSKVKGFFALDKEEDQAKAPEAPKEPRKKPAPRTMPVRAASKSETKQSADREKTQSIDILSVPDGKKVKKSKPLPPKQQMKKPARPAKNPAEAPTEETVVFTDDMTRQFSPGMVKKASPPQGKKTVSYTHLDRKM